MAGIPDGQVGIRMSLQQVRVAHRQTMLCIRNTAKHDVIGSMPDLWIRLVCCLTVPSGELACPPLPWHPSRRWSAGKGAWRQHHKQDGELLQLELQSRPRRLGAAFRQFKIRAKAERILISLCSERGPDERDMITFCTEGPKVDMHIAMPRIAYYTMQAVTLGKDAGEDIMALPLTELFLNHTPTAKHSRHRWR